MPRCVSSALEVVYNWALLWHKPPEVARKAAMLLLQPLYALGIVDGTLDLGLAADDAGLWLHQLVHVFAGLHSRLVNFSNLRCTETSCHALQRWSASVEQGASCASCAHVLAFHSNQPTSVMICMLAWPASNTGMQIGLRTISATAATSQPLKLRR